MKYLFVPVSADIRHNLHLHHSAVDHAFAIKLLAPAFPVWCCWVRLIPAPVARRLESSKRRGGRPPKWWWAGLGVGLDRINPLQLRPRPSYLVGSWIAALELAKPGRSIWFEVSSNYTLISLTNKINASRAKRPSARRRGVIIAQVKGHRGASMLEPNRVRTWHRLYTKRSWY